MDQDPQSIKELFRQMMSTGDGNIIEAKVISASPLKVQATNDDKLVLTAASLVVPRHLTNYSTTATFSLGKGGISSVTEGDGKHEHTGGSHSGHVGSDGSHSHSGDGTHGHYLVTFALEGGTITVYNALKEGEIVYLLPFNEEKKYYILDRRG